MPSIVEITGEHLKLILEEKFDRKILSIPEIEINNDIECLKKLNNLNIKVEFEI